jgi:multidrug efflux pump subunit AcrB
VRLPSGTGVGRTERTVSLIEEELKALPDNELVGFSVRLGTKQLLPFTDHRDSENSAVINVYLSPVSERERTAEQILTDLRIPIHKKTAGEGSEVFLELTRYGPPMGKPFEIRIISDDDDQRREFVDEIYSFVSGLDGVEEVERNDMDLVPRFEAIPEVGRLIKHGVPARDILDTLRIAFHGDTMDYTTASGERIRIFLTAGQEGIQASDLLDHLYIMRGRIRQVPLSKLVNVEETLEPGSIHRINGKRVTTISGSLNNRKIDPETVHTRVKEVFSSRQGVTLKFAGQPVENKRVFGDLKMAVGLAVVGIYILISVTMNSVFWPLIVIAAVPFGLIGVVLSLLVHDMPLSVFAGTALVGTIGIVVNGSILMVYKLREREVMPPPAGSGWIIEVATTRLRPILLTTVTTVLGILPAAIGMGGYDPFLSPMCLSLIYGLTVGSLLTLFLVPILFSVSCDMRGKRKSGVSLTDE